MTTGLALSVLLALGLAGLARASPPLRLEVTAGRHVTLSGRGVSLKTLIEDLCWRTGVELRSYDAEDRAFGAHYSDVPLSEALQRLLDRESFLIGTTLDAAGRPQVSWLRVLGEHEAARAHRAEQSLAPGERRFEVPPLLLRSAFAGDDDAERQESLRRLVTAIRSDPEQLRGFMSTDSHSIAEALARFAHSVELLRALHTEIDDPAVKGKLEEILAALEQMQHE